MRKQSGTLPQLGTADLLAAINQLSGELQSGFGRQSAHSVASTAAAVLGLPRVVVTDTEKVLAGVGHELPHPAIEEQTATVIDRHRFEKPTVYQVASGEGSTDIAVAVFHFDDVPLGAIHVVTSPEVRPPLAELTQFAGIVSSQLALADLEQSRTAAAQAELVALRAQISPHFVHNSLTAIAGFVHRDPDRARALLGTFAEFLRATFRTRGELSNISDELQLVEIYLELEQARFGDRFETSLRVAPEVLGVQLPFLTIQPIVENAIRHGLEHREGRGLLKISVVDQGAEAQVVVEDDGVGIDPEVLAAALEGRGSTPHVGVLAVDERLRTTFGAEYGLVISTASGAGTCVTMQIPKYVRDRR